MELRIPEPPALPYTLSGPDSRDVVTVQFTLSSAASVQWADAFNQWRPTIRAKEGSPTITVTDFRRNVIARDVTGAVKQLVAWTDSEVSEDSLKNAILLTHLRQGMVVIHESLAYAQPPSIPAPMSQPFSPPHQLPETPPNYQPMWFEPYLDLVASRNFAL